MMEWDQFTGGTVAIRRLLGVNLRENDSKLAVVWGNFQCSGEVHSLPVFSILISST